jgi:hypothetical protein
MAAPEGNAIDLSETAGDPRGPPARIIMAQDACIDRRATVSRTVLREGAVGGLNFWDRQSGSSGFVPEAHVATRPAGCEQATLRPMASETISGPI